MLKLVGSLRNGSSRLSSRCGARCMPNHQLTAGCKSTAIAPQVNIETPSVIDDSPKESVDSQRTLKKSKMVREAFSQLDMGKSGLRKKGEGVSAQQIVDDLLSKIDTKYISHKQAVRTMAVLNQQVENGAIDLKQLQSDVRYQKFSKIITRKIVSNVFNDKAMDMNRPHEWTTNASANSVEKYLHSLNDLHSITDVAAWPVDQGIQMFCGLAAKQLRSKPLLQSLAELIIQSTNDLTMKNIADILYSMVKLNFINEPLLAKLSQQLQVKIDKVDRSPIIGSILTSIGMMRYRNTALINTLCDWMVKHKNILRTQDVCAFLVTLGVLGYSPTNFQVLYKDIIEHLKITDMIKASEWVDVVWSLVVLNQATSEHIQSALNEHFVNQLIDQDDIPISKKRKLLNINAMAKYLLKDYSGPLLKDDSIVMQARILMTKEKDSFVKSITDALANLFPSREHFQSNIDNKIGFLTDVEFFIDKKFITFPISKVTDDTKAFRIAIMANYYHDFCIGEKSLIGPAVFHKRLLETMGYRVLDISHSDFHIDDKLLKRISYLNERIKAIVK